MADNDNHLLRWLQVQTLWTKIKNLVNAETTRATKAEAAIDGTITTLTAAVSAEQTRAEAKEKENADAITAEVNRATTKEAELDAAIKTNAETAKAYTDTTAETTLTTAKTYADTTAETAINSAKAYTDTTAETTLTTAKTYADNVAKGAMVWLGMKTWAELQAITDARKGDFYTISDMKNKEFAWDGKQWQDIGADVDFSQIQTDVNNNKSDISNLKTSVASKAEDNNVVHLRGNEVINGMKTINNLTLSDVKFKNDDQSYLRYTIENNDAKSNLLRLIMYPTNHGLSDGLRWSNALIVDAYTSLSGGNKLSIGGRDGDGQNGVWGEICKKSSLCTEIKTEGKVIPTGGAVYNYLNDSSNNFVHKSGDETIGGIKKFTGDIHVTDPKAIIRGYNVGKIDGRMILGVTEYEGNGQTSVILESRKDNPRIRLATGTDELEVKPSSTNASEIKSGSKVLMTGGAIYNYLANINDRLNYITDEMIDSLQ